MTQFESRLPEIEAARAHLAFIAAEKRDGMWRPAKFLAKHPIASPFLLDEDRTVTKVYGLHHALGTDAIDIAHPATLVIARDINDKGLIRYIYRGDNQLDRAPLDDVVREVQKLSK
jgi:peroxiredoxin